MNESSKTAVFVAMAVVIALITLGAWKLTTLPQFSDPEKVAMEGKQLFPKFTDPLAATSLEIVKYDEQAALPVPFKVAQADDQWSIPSHSDYPADAKDQLGEAAASMIGLSVIDMASDDPDKHQMYGVIDPESKLADTATESVGTRVVMRDKSDALLMGIIIGDQVPDRDELHFVRKIGQDNAGENAVYTVAVKTDKLSNKFEDWIEEDLLKLNTWDVRKVHIQDYSIVEQGGQLAQRRGGQMSLDYNDTGDPKWSIVEDLVFNAEQRKMEPAVMADDEELDTKKLDNMKNALDDLKIVDAERKPPGLSGDLKAEGTLSADVQTQFSLQSKGYYLVPVQAEGRIYADLFSNQGELRVSMKDGVEYALRFGEIAGASGEEEGETSQDAPEESEEPEESEDSESKGVNRYLFVMAQFNPDLLEKPELEPLPEAKPTAEDADPTDQPAEGDQPAEADQAEGDPAEGAGQAESDEPAEEEAASEADLQAERERIEKENQRKQEEYDEKVKKGQERVDELNERFADWYYVISDEVFQKVRLERTDVVKKKEKEEEEGEDSADAEADGAGSAIMDFEAMKEEGLGGEN